MCESSAGGGIRTHEPLRDRDLNPAPLTWLGDPRRNQILSALSNFLFDYNLHNCPNIPKQGHSYLEPSSNRMLETAFFRKWLIHKFFSRALCPTQLTLNLTVGAETLLSAELSQTWVGMAPAPTVSHAWVNPPSQTDETSASVESVCMSPIKVSVGF